MGIAKTLRERLAVEIEAKRGAGTYVYNSFRVEETHRPFIEREDPKLSDGIVSLTVAAFDEETINRGNLPFVMDLPVLIFMQRAVDGDDSLEAGDQWVDLAEEIMDTARDMFGDTDNYSHFKNEQMKDGVNYPFTFSKLRQQSVLEIGFLAHYTYTHAS